MAEQQEPSRRPSATAHGSPNRRDHVEYVEPTGHGQESLERVNASRVRLGLEPLDKLRRTHAHTSDADGA
jgi:hypothetical protein